MIRPNAGIPKLFTKALEDARRTSREFGAVITLHRDIAFSGPTPLAVGQKLSAFQSRCAARDVHCHVGVGDVAFGERMVVTYEVTLIGEPQAIDDALNPAAAARSPARRSLRSARPIPSLPATRTTHRLN